MQYRLTDYASFDYKKLLTLREAVLRLPLGLRYTAEELAKEPDYLHLGAFDISENACGCILLRPEEGTLWRLKQMAVSQELQGQGIGAQLIRFAEAEARKRGAIMLVLNARDTARGFYEKLGYQIEGEQFTEIDLPHWRMVKVVA